MHDAEQGGGRGGGGGTEGGEYVFRTSLGLNMAVEAALAWLVFPPVGGVALLVFERESDYVRLVKIPCPPVSVLLACSFCFASSLLFLATREKEEGESLVGTVG